MGTPDPTTPAPIEPGGRHVRWCRDAAGTAYAVEVFDAHYWDPRWLEPPAPEVADARIVYLSTPGDTPGDRPPATSLPPWLRVEAAPALREPASREAALREIAPREAAPQQTQPRSRSIAEAAPAYRTSASPTAPTTPSATAPTVAPENDAQHEDLWRGSPYHRRPGPMLAVFVEAAIVALACPDRPAAATPSSALARLVAFARGRPAPLGQIATVHAQGGDDAAERWLQFALRTPERLHDEVLIARLADDGRSDLAAPFRDLRDAPMPADGESSPDEHAVDPHWTELAVDRDVLLEQLTPRLALTGTIPPRVVAAAGEWLARYRRAHERHVCAAIPAVTTLAAQMEAQHAAVQCLARLNRISALGPATGTAEIEHWEAMRRDLAAYPSSADRDPSSGRVTPGRPPIVLAEAARSSERLARAFEQRRARLAAMTATRLLQRRGVPALDRLMQAIQVSDVDAIHRVLDDALAATIDQMLTEAPPSILDQLAQRIPTVTAAEVDTAVAIFRGLLEVGIAQSDAEHVHLADPGAA